MWVIEYRLYPQLALNTCKNPCTRQSLYRRLNTMLKSVRDKNVARLLAVEREVGIDTRRHKKVSELL